MIKYIRLEWPEYQGLEDHPRYEECFWELGGYNLFVPEDLYQEIMINKLYPTEFDLPIGHIRITMDEIELNGVKYTRDESKLKRGSEVILYNSENGYWTTVCTAYSNGFPPLFEDGSMLIDSEIIGIKNE